MHIAIILLNWNGKKDTIECLESLKGLTYKNYTVIIADNGSSDDSLTMLSSLYPQHLFLDNQANLGFAEGNNRAILYALEKGFDALLLLNNDTVVDPSFLTAFVDLAAKHPKSILGAKPYLYSTPTHFDHFGGYWNPEKGSFDLVGNRLQEDNLSFEAPFELDYVCGCALFAKAEAFKELGVLDPRFFLFWEESDFCFRAKKQHYRILFCPQAKLWHKVSASFVGGKKHTTYFWWRNRLLFIEKHFSLSQICSLYIHSILPEIFKLMRHHLILYLHYGFYILFRSSKRVEKKEKLSLSSSALCGIRHYFMRRFYNGPSWIFAKTR
jgi:GT2 family glycosyltransferase